MQRSNSWVASPQQQPAATAAISGPHSRSSQFYSQLSCCKPLAPLHPRPLCIPSPAPARETQGRRGYAGSAGGEGICLQLVTKRQHRAEDQRSEEIVRLQAQWPARTGTCTTTTTTFTSSTATAGAAAAAAAQYVASSAVAQQLLAQQQIVSSKLNSKYVMQ